MAKQKIPTEDTALGVGAETFQEQPADGVALQEDAPVETAIADPQVDAPQPKQPPTPSTEKKEVKEAKENPQEPDSYVLGILKSYPSYRSLYVDKHGGVFTPDTAERIRGSATLYKNPHFKQN